MRQVQCMLSQSSVTMAESTKNNVSGQRSNCPGKALGIKPGIADSRHTNEMTKRSPGVLRLEGAE